MNLFNLMAKLTLDKSDYEKGLKEVTNQTQSSTSKVQSKLKEYISDIEESIQIEKELFEQGKIGLEEFAEDFKTMNSELKDYNKLLKDTDDKTSATTTTSVIGWVAVATAITAVINKLANLAMQTAEYTKQIGDLANKWGFSTEQIQEFDYWATQNGTTIDSLLMAMRGLVNQAQEDSTVFDKLGVSVRDNTGQLKDQRTLFLETITALQKVENQTERNALQFDIFGRSGIQLGQIVNKTSEELNALSQQAKDYGIIINDSAIKQTTNFVNELDTLKRQFTSVITSFLTNEENFDVEYNKFIDNLQDKIKAYLPTFLKFLIKSTSYLVTGLIESIPAIIQALFDTIIDLDWFKLGVDVAISFYKGFINTLLELVQTLFGKGWLWGQNNDVQLNNTTEAINSVTSSGIVERTEKIDEKLEITLNVESDGTVAGEKNLEVISDLVVDKINKMLGDNV